MKQPENNSGFIYAKFDEKWVRVRPPRESSMTDEQDARGHSGETAGEYSQEDARGIPAGIR